MQTEAQLWSKNSRLMVIAGGWGPVTVAVCVFLLNILGTQTRLFTPESLSVALSLFTIAGFILKVLLAVGLGCFIAMFSGKDATLLKLVRIGIILLAVSVLISFFYPEWLMLLATIDCTAFVILVVSFFLLSRSATFPVRSAKASVYLCASYALFIPVTFAMLMVKANVDSSQYVTQMHQFIFMAGSLGMTAAAIVNLIGWIKIGQESTRYD